MPRNTKTPNKKIRTILLGLILLLYLSSIIYVAITKENNKLSSRRLDSITEVENDKYSDDYYDDDYDDDYYYDDEEEDGDLDVNSYTVKSLYSYVKLYPYVSDIPTEFKTVNLTEEQKMRLVAASLKSKEIETGPLVIDVTEQDLILNNKIYTLVTPNVRYKKYEVVTMYDEIFGTSDTLDTNVIMYDGDNTLYKYNEDAYGYVKFIAQQDDSTTTSTKTEVVKAVKTNGNIELYIKAGTQTEKYIFTPTSEYSSIYMFTERTTTQNKNSL